jgi:hypothetical protein
MSPFFLYQRSLVQEEAMTTLHIWRTQIQRVSRRSLLPGLFAALVLSHVSGAALIPFMGNLSITVAAPPLSPNPGFLFPDDTNGNEISLILTNNSNADARITNVAAPTFGGMSNPITSATLSGEDECVGTVLGPGGSCGFYIVFGTANIFPNFTLPATIQDSVSASFSTTKTDGVQPFRLVRTYTKTANLTVYDSSISSNASTVPEPETYVLAGLGLIAVGVAGRRKAKG